MKKYYSIPATLIQKARDSGAEYVKAYAALVEAHAAKIQAQTAADAKANSVSKEYPWYPGDEDRAPLDKALLQRSLSILAEIVGLADKQDVEQN